MTIAEALSEAQEVSIDRAIALQDFLYLLEEITGLSKPQLQVFKHRVLSDSESQLWTSYLHRRLRGEPSQYIVGKSHFYGREFHVSPVCLIPRPETEGLVELALKQLEGMNHQSRVLDIGTGSGVIAISIKLERPECVVLALDISAEALDIARQNAQDLAADVLFTQADLWPSCEEGFDLIVSNPPYVTEDEYASLDQCVRDFEPKLALVASENGLEFYQRILSGLGSRLNEGGSALFEIGACQATELKAMAIEHGFTSPEVLHDLTGRDRYLKISI